MTTDSRNRALIYGFEPYLGYSENVTKAVVAEISRRNIATGIVFDVVFDANMFSKAVRAANPQVVIGLGQHPRARKIRIERRARNWRASPSSDGRKISSNGPDVRYVSFKVPQRPETTITYDAGSYVCNFSMYVMCDLTSRLGVPYAFLHVPRSATPLSVVGLIEELLP